MARTNTPTYDPRLTPDQWKELHEMAFEAEQAIADIMAISKVAADGLSNDIKVYDGYNSMFNAKHSIIALTRLLETVYDDHIYPLSMQLSDLISDMEQPTEPPKESV